VQGQARKLPQYREFISKKEQAQNMIVSLKKQIESLNNQITKNQDTLKKQQSELATRKKELSTLNTYIEKNCK
jgi:peptidoglycan hydrolase CwlO-like protein